MQPEKAAQACPLLLPAPGNLSSFPSPQVERKGTSHKACCPGEVRSCFRALTRCPQTSNSHDPEGPQGNPQAQASSLHQGRLSGSAAPLRALGPEAGAPCASPEKKHQGMGTAPSRDRIASPTTWPLLGCLLKFLLITHFSTPPPARPLSALPTKMLWPVLGPALILPPLGSPPAAPAGPNLPLLTALFNPCVQGVFHVLTRDGCWRHSGSAGGEGQVSN